MKLQQSNIQVYEKVQNMISKTDLLDLKLKSFPILTYWISRLTYSIYRHILTRKIEKKPKTQSLYRVEHSIKHGE